MGRHKSNSVAFKGATQGAYLLVSTNSIWMRLYRFWCHNHQVKRKHSASLGLLWQHSAGIGTYADAFAFYSYIKRRMQTSLYVEGKSLEGFLPDDLSNKL